VSNTPSELHLANAVAYTRTGFKIPDVTAKVIMEAMEGVCHSGSSGLSVEKIASYINSTPSYARRAMEAALQLKMAKEVNEKYIAESESMDIICVNKSNGLYSSGSFYNDSNHSFYLSHL
jgi:hypothetical protein